jgi:hypothetical protein
MLDRPITVADNRNAVAAMDWDFEFSFSLVRFFAGFGGNWGVKVGFSPKGDHGFGEKCGYFSKGDHGWPKMLIICEGGVRVWDVGDYS